MKEIKVVGIAYIKDNKLLIVKSKKIAKLNKYTFIGGGVEKNEDLIDAAIRESIEELGDKLVISKDKLKCILNFKEKATSNPNLIIDMNVFLSDIKIDFELIPNEEILEYKWYSLNEDDNILSDSIKKHFIPYAIKNNILKAT